MKQRRRIVLPPHEAVTVRSIILDKNNNGVKGALIEDGQPLEFIISSKDRQSVIGCIYAGRVESVSKSGFAFVDIGTGKNAFLNLNDNKDIAGAASVKAGRAVMVQVLKDPIQDKGAYVTTRLTWPGRFFVVESAMGAEPLKISVSKKITSERERERLSAIAADLLPSSGLHDKNIILRTESLNAAPSSLGADLTELSEIINRVELSVKSLLEESTCPGFIPRAVYTPHSGACSMIVSEFISGDIKDIIINDESEKVTLSEKYAPRGISVKFEQGNLFKAYNLEKPLEQAKKPLVHLPSGGYILIERTQTCVVIDVNSGQYSGRKNMEDMALKINLEAAREAARQLRLRNLGGIILIDFIGMKDPANAEALAAELKKSLAKDRAATVVEGMTRLGLMEMTRKRTRSPLGD